MRHRGTIGGALSHADPAGDLPAVVTALDASLVVTGPSGSRTIAPADFFTDYLTTSLAPGEILTAIRVPKLDGWGYRYEKFHLTAQAWAVDRRRRRRTASPTVTSAEARSGLTNMGSVPPSGRTRLRRRRPACGAEASAARRLAAAAQSADEAHPALAKRPGAGAADYRRHLAPRPHRPRPRGAAQYVRVPQ